MKFKKLINNSVKELLFAQTDARILVSNYINWILFIQNNLLCSLILNYLI